MDKNWLKSSETQILELQPGGKGTSVRRAHLLGCLATLLFQNVLTSKFAPFRWPFINFSAFVAFPFVGLVVRADISFEISDPIDLLSLILALGLEVKLDVLRDIPIRPRRFSRFFSTNNDTFHQASSSQFTDNNIGAPWLIGAQWSSRTSFPCSTRRDNSQRSFTSKICIDKPFTRYNFFHPVTTRKKIYSKSLVKNWKNTFVFYLININ